MSMFDVTQIVQSGGLLLIAAIIILPRIRHDGGFFPPGDTLLLAPVFSRGWSFTYNYD